MSNNVIRILAPLLLAGPWSFSQTKNSGYEMGIAGVATYSFNSAHLQLVSGRGFTTAHNTVGAALLPDITRVSASGFLLGAGIEAGFKPYRFTTQPLSEEYFYQKDQGISHDLKATIWYAALRISAGYRLRIFKSVALDLKAGPVFRTQLNRLHRVDYGVGKNWSGFPTVMFSSVSELGRSEAGYVNETLAHLYLGIAERKIKGIRYRAGVEFQTKALVRSSAVSRVRFKYFDGLSNQVGAENFRDNYSSLSLQLGLVF